MISGMKSHLSSRAWARVLSFSRTLSYTVTYATLATPPSSSISTRRWLDRSLSGSTTFCRTSVTRVYGSASRVSFTGRVRCSATEHPRPVDGQRDDEHGDRECDE